MTTIEPAGALADVFGVTGGVALVTGAGPGPVRRIPATPVRCGATVRTTDRDPGWLDDLRKRPRMPAAKKSMKQRLSRSIVVAASTVGLRADPLVSHSSVVAKAGIVNLVRQAALDLARWQVRVNTIAPGPFRTNIRGGGRVNRPAWQARWGTTVALGRLGRPPGRRGLALLLASPASSSMTGGVNPCFSRRHRNRDLKVRTRKGSDLCG